jgi:GT2 family glycosyltransferase
MVRVEQVALAGEIRRRLGEPPERARWPLVSIIVLNRDGVDHLRRLLAGLIECTDYPEFELILVDNGSSDDSLAFIRAVEAPFPISIVANAHNESFSDGCNQGAELAAGRLLLFLNNDIEPFERGWLRDLVTCLGQSEAGAVGATLIEPEPEPQPAAGSLGFTVHQRGLIGRLTDDLPTTGFRDHGANPLDSGLGRDVEVSAVAGACLLIRRGDFDAVGGFSHGYMYGPEDVDLALKLRAAGLRIVCSGRSIVIHRTTSTLSAIDPELRASWIRGNRRLFWERWGPRLHREIEFDRLRGGGLWIESVAADADREVAARAEVERLAYCLKAGDPRDGECDDGSRELIEALGRSLRRRGYRCLTLWGGETGDLRGLDCDVAVHLHGSARLVSVPAQLNVLWVPDEDQPPGAIERSRYDLVLLGPWEAHALQIEDFAARLLATVDAHAASVGWRTAISSDTALKNSVRI